LLYAEPFLARLRVLRQRAIRKAVLARLVDHVNDPRHMERPESQMSRYNSDRAAASDRCVRPAQFEPSHLKHLPLLQSKPRALEEADADTQGETLAMHLISDRRLRPRGAHLRVGKRSTFL